jgi:hypothetical protein
MKKGVSFGFLMGLIVTVVILLFLFSLTDTGQELLEDLGVAQYLTIPFLAEEEVEEEEEEVIPEGCDFTQFQYCIEPYLDQKRGDLIITVRDFQSNYFSNFNRLDFFVYENSIPIAPSKVESLSTKTVIILDQGLTTDNLKIANLFIQDLLIISPRTSYILITVDGATMETTELNEETTLPTTSTGNAPCFWDATFNATRALFTELVLGEQYNIFYLTNNKNDASCQITSPEDSTNLVQTLNLTPINIYALDFTKTCDKQELAYIVRNQDVPYVCHYHEESSKLSRLYSKDTNQLNIRYDPRARTGKHNVTIRLSHSLGLGQEPKKGRGVVEVDYGD